MIFYFRCTVSFIFALFLIMTNSWATEVYLETTATAVSHTSSTLVPDRGMVIITADDVQKSTATNISDLISQWSVINMQQRGSFGMQGDVSIRGATFEQYTIMLNGFPINDPQTGHHNLDLPITLAEIERIEIIPGQISSLYGSYGQGGLINIVTKQSFNRQMKAGITVGENHLAGGWASATIPTGKLSHSFSTQRLISRGWREDTEFNTNILNYQLDMIHPFGNTNIFTGFVQKDFGAYKFYSSTYPDELEKTSVFLFTAKTKISLKNQEWQPQASFRLHRDYFILDRNRPDWSFNNHRNTSINFGFPFKLQLPRNTIILGIDMKQDTIDSTNLNQHHRNSFSSYTEYLPHLPPKWKMQLGLRDDFYSSYHGKGIVSPSINLNYQLKSDWTWLAGAGRSFRIPTFTELYYADPANMGDNNLEAEKGWNYESGFKYSAAQVEWQNIFFWRDIKNTIDWTKGETDKIWQARNISVIKSYGLETAVAIKNMVKINYQYLNSTIDSAGYKSKYSTNYLKHQVGLKIRCALPYQWRNDWFLTYRKLNQLSGYTLIDLKISKQLSKNWTVFIQGTNLFNTYYEEITGTPRPGRWLQLGVNWND